MSAQTTRLADHQRAMLALLKERPVPAAPEPYLDLVRDAAGLRMIRRITAWWRRFDLERLTPLTARALTNAGRFDDELARLGTDPHTPSTIDGLTAYFLEQQIRDTDPLIAAVASTERALSRVSRGDRTRHEVIWDRDPVAILNALMAGRPPDRAVAGHFSVTVSADLPTRIAVDRIGPATDDRAGREPDPRPD